MSALPSPRRAAARCFFPLLLWLGLQLLALGLALAPVRFWTSPPQPLDRLALAELLIVQCAASALLFPLLLRTVLSAAMVIVVAWPFCQLAAFVSSTPAGQWIGAAGALSLWLVGLGLWRIALRSQFLQQVGVTIAALLTLGGPVAVYLVAEFGTAAAPAMDWPRAAALGPILSCLGALGEAGGYRARWVFLGIHVMVAGGAALVAWRRRLGSAAGAI